MMSQMIAPIYSYKNPRIYYQTTWKDNLLSNSNSFFNFLTTNRASYDDSDLNSSSLLLLIIFLIIFSKAKAWKTRTKFFCGLIGLIVCLFVCLGNLAVHPNSDNLAVWPNSEKPGSPNSPTNKK